MTNEKWMKEEFIEPELLAFLKEKDVLEKFISAIENDEENIKYIEREGTLLFSKEDPAIDIEESFLWDKTEDGGEFWCYLNIEFSELQLNKEAL